MSNRGWVIVIGHGATKRFWCFKDRDYYWYFRPDNAKVYATARNAHKALARIRKHHDLLPEWHTRIEQYPPVR